MPHTVKKTNWQLNAELKTIADYALMLEYMKGYSKKDAQSAAIDAQHCSHALFLKLLKRNEELFKTGSVVIL